jgi:hypothetical protein
MPIRPRSMREVALSGIAALLAILVSSTNVDPDLWGHLRFGMDILRTWHLSPQDPYSFTSDIAWTNHEWLSELALAVVYLPLGAAGLNLLKLGVIVAVAALTWRVAKRSGAAPFSASLITVLIVVSTYTRTQQLRPQLFSVLLFCLLLVLIDRIERTGAQPFLAIAAIFCCWANMHGGWIVGVGIFAVWSAFDLRRRLGLLIVAVAATLINPYGIGLWKFIYDTVGLARPEISDWRPVLALPGPIIGIELALPLLAIGSIAKTRRVPPASHLAIIAILAFSTYRIGRTDAFFQIAVAWLCAPAILEWIDSIGARARPSGRLLRLRTANGLVAAAMVTTALAVALPRLGRITVEGDWTPDREALAFIEQRAAHGCLLTWFDWGEYAIWHLADSDLRVSMDGRRETVYSASVIRDHFAFYGNTMPEAWRYPDTIGADRIWLPRKLPVVSVLQDHGWHPIFSNDKSIVLSRAGAPSLASAGTSLAPARAAAPVFP